MKIFAILSACLCLYKEEVGAYDWHQPHVGIVKHIVRSNNEILVSTEPGIVALMDENSHIKWRRELGGSVDAIIRDGRNNLVLEAFDHHSSYSHSLYSIDENGFQNWNVKIKSFNSNQLQKMRINREFVYVLFSDRLVKISNRTVVYTANGFENGMDFVVLDDDIVLVIESPLRIRPIDKSGSPLPALEYEESRIVDTASIELTLVESNPYLIFKTTKGYQFTKLGLKKSPVISLSEKISKDSLLVIPKSHQSIAPAVVLVKKTSVEVLKFNGAGVTEPIAKFEKTDLQSSIFHFSLLDKSNFEITMIGQLQDLLYYETIISKDGVAKSTSKSIKFDFTLTGDIQWASVDFHKNNPSVVVGTLDGSFHLFNEQKRWTMEESLTDTAVSVLMDIPCNPDKPVDLMHLVHESIPDRIIRHYTDFINLFTGKSDKVENELLLSHDHHGFKKLAIFGSKNGKFVAVETEEGKTVWTRFLPTLEPKYLFVTRDHKSGMKPVLTLVAGVKGSEETVSMLIDALTGKDFKNSKMTSLLKTAGLANYAVLTDFADDNVKIKAVAVVTSKSSVLFPSTNEIQNQFEQKSFYYYLTPGIGSTYIHGFRLRGKVALQTWRMDFPEGEEIAAMDLPDKSPVANVGRVLGDRRVLYKYLNPNLASILTVKVNGKESTVYSYLIDLVSGKIHERHVHYGAGFNPGKNKGVKTMICENFVVYTFWNFGNNDSLPNSDRDIPSSPTDHYEMVVLELYQSATPDVRHDRSNYSSFDSDRLESLGFSFVIENGISAISVTTTHAGITSREILVAFEHGMLQGLSRKFLDPRRPVGALTAEQKEEGLIPYFPAMPIHGPLIVTYYLQVLGINKIQSIATNLESTSIIVASGIDLFSTRRMPSKPFDTLSSDFSYTQLIASILVLSLAVVVTDRAVESKRVREAWV